MFKILLVLSVVCVLAAYAIPAVATIVAEKPDGTAECLTFISKLEPRAKSAICDLCCKLNDDQPMPFFCSCARANTDKCCDFNTL